MADGLFDSDSSSDSSSSSHYYGNHGWDIPTEVAVAIIVVFVVIIGIILFRDYAAREEERVLDRTVYVQTSRANFDKWQSTRVDDLVTASLWFEEGSSHHDKYHCKGGQFQVKSGTTVTFCCSVIEGENPACLVLL